MIFWGWLHTVKSTSTNKKKFWNIDSWWFNREIVSNNIQMVGHGNNNLGQKMDSKCLERERKAIMWKIWGTKLSANGGWVDNYFSRCTYVNVRIQFIHQWYKGKAKQSNTNILFGWQTGILGDCFAKKYPNATADIMEFNMTSKQKMPLQKRLA